MLGAAFALEYCNKGYGTEALTFVVNYAFKSLALHRVSLDYFGHNARAAAVYAKM